MRFLLLIPLVYVICVGLWYWLSMDSPRATVAGAARDINYLAVEGARLGGAAVAVLSPVILAMLFLFVGIAAIAQGSIDVFSSDFWSFLAKERQ